MKTLSWLAPSASVLAFALASGAAAQAVTAPAETPAPAAPQVASAVPTSNDPVPGEIVVTAQKRAETLSNVPMSITAVTGAALQEKGINDVQSLVKVTPGLSYVESGLGVPVYSLRGVGFFDTSIGARPTVSVYVDEAPLPFSIMSQGASFDLERVEVLKGPQGTLFGQNATGGAINYIAAKPQDTFHAGFMGSYARFNTADFQGYITGPLTPTLDYRIAARYVRSDGWQQSYTRDDTIGRQNFFQERFLLDWHPSDRLKVSLNVNGFLDHGDTQAAQLIGKLLVTPGLAGNVPDIVNYPLAPHNDRAADWDPGTDFRKDNHMIQTALRADYKLTDDITLTSLTSYSHMKVDQNNDVDATAVFASNIAVVGKVSSVSEELRLAGDMGPVRWIIGGNYSRDKSYENDYNVFPYASANYAFTPLYSYNLSNPFTRQDFSTKAVFGNVDWTIGKIILHGGIRYTQADLDYGGCTRVSNDESGAAITTLFNAIRAGQGLPALPFLKGGQCQSLDATLTPNFRTGKLDENNVSWRAGVDYKINSDVLLYANVSKGYKAGSAPVPGAINLNEFNPVTQESLLAYEAGFKISLLNRKVQVSGAGFYYQYHNKQLLARSITTPNVLGALPALVNVPRSWIKGGEAQITVFPVKGLSLSAAGTYLDSKVTSDFVNYSIIAVQANFKGEAFPYTPKWQFVLDGEYKFPLTDGLDGVLGANMNHNSHTTAGFGTSDFLKIKAYTLLDLRAGVEAPDGKWSAQIFGRNVTNTYYWTNVAKFNDTVRRYAGLPATYGVQVSFKF